MGLAVRFLGLLTSIPSIAGKQKGGTTAERFKEPFTETLFKNTERLQMSLRRGLFTTLLQSKDEEQIVLDFFTRMESDLPDVNLLQKSVTSSYDKAKKCFSHFLFVHNFRLKGGSGTGEDITFVDSKP